LEKLFFQKPKLQQEQQPEQVILPKIAFRGNNQYNNKLKKYRRELILSIIGGIFAVYILWWNLNNIGAAPDVPYPLYMISWPTMTYQAWSMFCPPPTIGWYHRVKLNFDDKTHAELLQDYGMQVWEASEWEGLGIETNSTDDIPVIAEVLSVYINHRWFKFWESFNWNEASDELRLQWGRYVCREWNARYGGDKRLKSHKTFYISWAVLPNMEREFRTLELQWDHVC